MSPPAQTRHLKRIADASQNYLLCKAAIERRLLEIAKCDNIEEQKRLYRIVAKLEASLSMHKALKDRLVAMDISDQ